MGIDMRLRAIVKRRKGQKPKENKVWAIVKIQSWVYIPNRWLTTTPMARLALAPIPEWANANILIPTTLVAKTPNAGKNFVE